MDYSFSDKLANLRPSAIREIFKSLTDPSIISFAAGNPSPESFPTEALAEAAKKVKAFVSVELSMGQMIEDIRLATGCSRPVTLCNRAGGMIPDPEQVLEAIAKSAEVNE